jgi:hypothetical protein
LPAECRPAVRAPAATRLLDGFEVECVGSHGNVGGHLDDLHSHSHSLGAEHLVHDLVDNPDRLSLYGADWPLPPDAPVRVIPIVDAVLLYPWSLLWLPTNTHPTLPDLLAEVPAVALPKGGRRSWTDVTDP